MVATFPGISDALSGNGSDTLDEDEGHLEQQTASHMRGVPAADAPVLLGQRLSLCSQLSAFAEKREDDWQNSPLPLDFDPLESVLPKVRSNSATPSIASLASACSPASLSDLRIGRWAVNVVNSAAASRRGKTAGIAGSADHLCNDPVDGRRGRASLSSHVAKTRASTCEANSLLSNSARDSRSSIISGVTASASITVQQFKADKQRTDDHCENVRHILRRSRGVSTHDPGAYLRVTDQRDIVCSVGSFVPRVFSVVRVGVVLWTSFHVPYMLAFLDGAGHCWAWSWLPDVLYLVGTLSQLLTSYVDSGTYEIASLSLVLRMRLRSPSWYADLLSCVPGCSFWLMLLKFVFRSRHVFLVRHDPVGVLTELPVLFRRSSISDTLRFSFLMLLLSVYLFAHLLGCLYHATVVQSSGVPSAASADVTPMDAYIEALRLSMSMMFSGTIVGPVGGEAEESRAVLFYVLLVPLVMFFITTVSAEVILLAQRACVLESQQFERLAMVDEANRSLNLPSPLRRKILEYNLWLTRSFNVSAYACLMQNTSKSAQVEVKLHLCAPFIATAPFLQEAPPSFICELLQSTNIMTVCAGDIIFHVGDPGLGMYFIIRGSCEIVNSSGHQLSELSQGTYFGEIALISGSTRLATVIATSFMLMAFFDRASFQELIRQHPGMLAAFVKHCSQYSGNLLTQQFIDRLGFFRDSPHQSVIIERLTSRLVQRSMPPGETVFEQGEKGDSMFFVLHGTLDVFRGAGGKVAELVDGAHFGELCLLAEGAERTATVKTRTACLLAELLRSDFEQVMRDFPDDVLRLLVDAASIHTKNERSEERFRRISRALTGSLDTSPMHGNSEQERTSRLSKAFTSSLERSKSTPLDAQDSSIASSVRSSLFTRGSPRVRMPRSSVMHHDEAAACNLSGNMAGSHCESRCNFCAAESTNQPAAPIDTPTLLPALQSAAASFFSCSEHDATRPGSSGAPDAECLPVALGAKDHLPEPPSAEAVPLPRTVRPAGVFCQRTLRRQDQQY